jgi:nitrogen regulation protein NR(I)
MKNNASMAVSGKILLIEDDASLATSIARALKAEDYEVELAHRGEDGLAQAKAGEFDVVITDLRLPGMDGMAVVRQLHEFKPRLPIILMTAFGTTAIAIEATQRGAFDYLVKGFEMETLIAVVEKAVANTRLMKATVVLGEAPGEGEAIIGNSRAMQDVYKEIGRVASKPVTVLIRGETGTGKELVARAIFQHSDRADQPFVAVNCAAIPETLLESELFGHERGAFTGAEARRIGRFEQAKGGTIFLDEIGDMTLFTQAKLLRVLQDQCIQRIGGKDTIPVDVRIIAATHCDLEDAIRDRKFREDLFYRLNAFVIHLPPLRERLEDVPALVKYFLKRFGQDLRLVTPGIQPEAVAWLQNQPWPGNVRQLANVIRQSMLQARDYPVSLEQVRAVTARGLGPAPPDELSLERQLDQLLDQAKQKGGGDVHARLMSEWERRLITRAWEMAEGDPHRVAAWLGLTRNAAREKLQAYGLMVPTKTSKKSTG